MAGVYRGATGVIGGELGRKLPSCCAAMAGAVAVFDVKVPPNTTRSTAMLTRTLLSASTAAVLIALPAAGAILNVPSTAYPTIQDALNATAPGDEVQVGPGSYVENLIFPTHTIDLVAVDGPSMTAIDGNGAGSCIQVPAGPGSASSLVGFTVANGLNFAGGGAWINAAQFRIEECVFRQNRATDGGGIFVGGASQVEIRDSFFDGNQASVGGGGAYADSGGRIMLKQSTLTHNEAGHGGGIVVEASCVLSIQRCTIDKNAALDALGWGGGAASASTNSRVLISNSTLTANESATGGGALRIYQASLGMFRSSMTDNIANGDGGGLLQVAGRAVVTDCDLLDNSAMGAEQDVFVGMTGHLWGRDAEIGLINSNLAATIRQSR